jgi:hypothetical protein
MVEVLTTNDRQLLIEHATLSGGDVLPGFAVSVHGFFPSV